MKRLLILIIPLLLSSFYSCGLLESENPTPNIQTIDVQKIYSINTDSTNLKLLSKGHSFILSQTGDSIFYSSDNSIYCMNIDGTNNHIITSGVNYDFALSSGKNKILFYQYPTFKPFFINTDGSGLTKLNTPDSIKNIGFADISPSGSKVVFTGSSGMYLMDIDGNNVRLFRESSNSSTYNNLHFTPDGNSVVYVLDGLLLKIYNLITETDSVLFQGFYNYKHFISYEISSWNSILFTFLSEQYLGIGIINLNNKSYSLLTRGSYAHYSIDGTLFSYVILDNPGLYMYNVQSEIIKHIDVNLPGNNLSDPRLTLDNSKLIFQADSTYYVKGSN